jgi:Kef-type K+ transport system membrane component KefB
MFAHISKWFQGDVALIQAANPLLVLSVILITGYIFNRLARKLHIPTVTCQILGGVVLGPYVLNLFVQNAYTSFVPITNFALGFIGLTIGSHLDFRKLHNAGRRIAFITLADAIITPVVVFFSLQLFTNVSLEASLLISAIAITTAPSSTLHIVREKRAKGIFTKTLLAVVALNNVITIVVFYTVYYFIYYITSTSHVGIVAIIIKPLLLLVESIIIGNLFHRETQNPRFLPGYGYDGSYHNCRNCRNLASFWNSE